MKTDSYYKFMIGGFEFIAISDGTFDYETRSLFSSLTEEEANNFLSDYPQAEGKIKSPYTFLYVNTGRNKILTDMGAGNLGPDTGKLAKNLRLAGIDPEDIDSVIITHAHPDHIGGTLDKSGKPKYPNATYYIWKDEWDFWFSDEAYQKVVEHYSAILHADVFMKAARGQLGPVEDRVVKITEEKEILPDVHVHFTPGHTPGHMAVSFSTQSEILFFIGDAVVFPFMIEYPEIEPVFDIIPYLANQTRKKLCGMLAEQCAWVLAQHFPPFPSLGHVVKEGETLKWEPVLID